MPAAPPVSTATGPPLQSANLMAELPLQTWLCTAGSILLGQGMLTTQGGHREQPTPSQHVPSPGR